MRDYFSARGWRVDLPELDLPPGDYRERKPKGWRWRLPWSHPEGAKLPAVAALASAAVLFYAIAREPDPRWWVLGAAAWGFGIGCGIMLALRD
jgi:hypothetical protein